MIHSARCRTRLCLLPLATAVALFGLVTAREARASQKALVNKVVASPSGSPTIESLPVLTIQKLGAKVVEEYDEMAVVDLGSTAAAALSQATGLLVSPLPDHDKVFLRDFTLDAVGGLPTGVAAPAFPSDHANLYLVVLRSIPKAEWVAALGATGAEVVSYIPQNTYLVYAALDDLRNLQAKNDFVVNILPFVPAFRLLDRPRLFGSDGYSKVTVQVLNVPSNEAVMSEIQAAALPGTFVRVGGGEVTLAFAQLPDGTIQGLAYSPEVVAIEPASQVAPSGERDALIVAGQLASASEIDPDTGQYRTVYKANQTVDYYAWLSQKGLSSASDISLGVLDTGLDTGSVDANGNPTDDIHIDFLGTSGHTRVQYLGNPAAAPDRKDCDGHGTLVTAIMAGSGGTTTGTPFSETATTSSPCAGCSGACPNPSTCSSGLFVADAGVAPAAKIAAAKIYNQVPGDPALVQVAVRNGLANFAALGVWATNLSSNSTTTAYDSFSQVLDQRVRDASGIGAGLPMTVAVSTGNVPGGVLSPANAKNVISVGASEGYNPFLNQTTCTSLYDANNAYDVASFSAAGTPDPDRRYKPDLVAPGTRTIGALTRYAPDTCWGQVSLYDKNCGRNPGGMLPGMGGANPITWSWGTSFSAPAVTGAAGLVARWYKGTHSGVRPSPAMTKAMLLNSALDIQGGKHKVGSIVYTIPHIPSAAHQGWGKVDLGRAFPLQGRYFDLDQTWLFPSSGANTYLRDFTILDSNKPVRITVVWTDKEAAIPAGVTLVNDLNLLVASPAWTALFIGDSFDSSTGRSHLYPSGQPLPYNNRDNVEEVVFQPGEVGWSTFHVQIWAQTIAFPPVQGGQDFALFVDNAY
jgi:hypothetical protein